MPNRILRAELIESEPWLALKDNADRAAWIACVLTVDTFGDMPAGPQRLVRLWRPYGIDTPEKAAKCFGDLVDVDLTRRYTADSKPYLHIPRFRQSCRWLGHVWPLSPWATNEEKQRFDKKTHAEHMRPPADLCGPPAEVGVEVGVGVDKSSSTSLVRAARVPRQKTPSTKGTRLPEDWRLPDEWLEWALQIRPDWTSQGVVRESITFRDYWLGRSGAGAVKQNWHATWRNWIRRCECEPVR